MNKKLIYIPAHKIEFGLAMLVTTCEQSSLLMDFMYPAQNFVVAG